MSRLRKQRRDERRKKEVKVERRKCDCCGKEADCTKSDNDAEMNAAAIKFALNNFAVEGLLHRDCTKCKSDDTLVSKISTGIDGDLESLSYMCMNCGFKEIVYA